jgi:hypothetical protein
VGGDAAAARVRAEPVADGGTALGAVDPVERRAAEDRRLVSGRHEREAEA